MKKIIISIKNSEYQIINSLKTNRNKRRKNNEVFIEGIESIKQASYAHLDFTRIITHSFQGLSKWAKSFISSQTNTKIIEMSYELYRQLCDREEPSELIATAKIKPLHLIDVHFSAKPFVLIFDRPSDHGNFGSIVRSANSFNVEAIFIVGHGIDYYDPKAIRSSLGSVFHSKIVQVQSLSELDEWIKIQKKKNGIEIVGTDSSGDVSLSTISLKKPIVIILGNEAKGMSVALKGLCDYMLRVPISGDVNSLNVSCAGSIFLWEVYRNSI